MVGTSTFFDIRALTLKGYGLDLQKDTQIVTATAPPDMVTLLGKKEVDAIIAWQPITDQVVLRGEGVYLAKQIDLWRKATGPADRLPRARLLSRPRRVPPEEPGDRAGPQRRPEGRRRHLVQQARARAMEIVAEVTKLPPNVIEVAHRETVRMLSGLPDEQVETLIAQLKINKEFGFLKSDIWDNPDRIRKEFFHRALSGPPLGARSRAGDRLHLPTLAARWRRRPGRGWSLLSWRYGAYVLPSPAPSSPGFGEIVRSGEIWKHTPAPRSPASRSASAAAVVVALLLGLGGLPLAHARAGSSTTSSPSSTPPRCSCGS